MKKKFHYSWVICLLCVLAIFCTIGMISNTFTLYLNALIEENGLTKAQGSSITTMRTLATFLSMFATTRYYNKAGLRRGMSFALVLIAAAFFLYSRGSSLPIFYMAAFTAGTGFGLGTMIPVTMIVNNWFVKSRGFVLGFASAGAGITPIVASPFITALLEKGGVALSASVQSLFVLAAALLMFILLRDKPEDMGLRPYGEAEMIQPADGGETLAAAPAEKKEFAKIDHMLMILATLVLGITASPCIDNAAVYMNTSGIDAAAITLSMTSFGILSIIGKFFYGAVADRLGAYIANYIVTFIYIVGVTIGVFMGTSSAMAVLFTGIMGLGFCLSTVSVSVWSIDFYPKEKLNSAVKTLQMTTTLGGLLSSAVPGIIADIAGNYQPFYMLAIAAAVIQLLIVQTRYVKYGKQKL